MGRKAFTGFPLFFWWH